MLKMEQTELAELAGVSLETVRRLERMDGVLAANSGTLFRLQSSLEQEGAVFLPESHAVSAVGLRREPVANIRARRRRGT